MKKKELILFFIGLILFFIVFIDIYWWIQISSDYSKSLAQVKKEYREKLPGFIATVQQVAIFNILFLAIASSCFLKAASLKKLKITARIFFVLCIIIGTWQLFTLM